MSSKGKWLTLEQKCEIIAQHRRHPSTNYSQLTVWAKTRFDLSVPPTRQTIRNIILGTADIEAKRRSAHRTAKGRNPCVRSQELETQLQQYVLTCQEHNVQLTRRLLRTRARTILDAMDNAPRHNLSDGWLTRFMKRHGLSFQQSYKEDSSESQRAGRAALPRRHAFRVDNVMPQEGPGQALSVDKQREKAKKRLRDIAQEAKELRKYLKRLDAATNEQLDP
ncbi:hypothetical protein PsorP6_013494 [Peronosclerospora sorghi]|uniref:Uncharacterized protein n=1 Tax=Peronosclerospora sorghi TaxID=230839 RepID=A0ACC0VH87_9STRA|nr:hypothetical protein PsorP6_013494 [Peronosclerospora sorghi]